MEFLKDADKIGTFLKIEIEKLKHEISKFSDKQASLYGSTEMKFLMKQLIKSWLTIQLIKVLLHELNLSFNEIDDEM